MFGFVGDLRGVVVLDNEGKRIIAKYYNNVGSPLETTVQQQNFERQLFLKSNKQSSSSSAAARSAS